MADKMLGTRDLNIFYLPTMGKRNLLENSEYLAACLPKDHVMIDRDIIQLVPRVQAQLEPKDLAKLVSPAKLRTELAREEKAHSLILPKVKCFHCHGDGVIYSNTPQHDDLKDSGMLSAKMSGLGLYSEVTWYYSKTCIIMKDIQEDDPNVECKPLASCVDDCYAFDSEFSATLEKALRDGSDTLLCSGNISGDEKVEVEVDLARMRVYDHSSMVQRELYRGEDGFQDDGEMISSEMDNKVRLSLHLPSSGSGDGAKEEPPLTCWVCFGSGFTSRWFNKEVAGIAGSPTLSVKRRISNQIDAYSKSPITDESVTEKAVDKHMPDCLICYYEPGIYGLSGECDHMFCADCASSLLNPF